MLLSVGTQMIWDWINTIAAFFRKLLIPPIPLVYIRRLNPHDPCPACGHCDAVLLSGTFEGKFQVRHSCKMCSARWFEDPVVQEYEPIAATSSSVKVVAPEPPKE